MKIPRYFKLKSMSQLLLKPVKRMPSLRALEIIPLNFSFSRNVQPNLLKLLNVQSFVFVLFASLFCSTNALAFHAKVNISSTNRLNHSANTAPVALDDAKSVNEDSFVSGLVGVNDLDIDGDVLTFTAISSVNPLQGTLIFNANGSYTFLPAANFYGVVIAQYKACDPSGLCDTATLTITIEPVNDAPVASISIITTPEDVPKTGDLKTRVLDIDNASNTLTFTQIGIMASIEGTYSLNADGTYLYTPAPNYVGTTAVTYKVCDPLNLCDTSTLIISIIKVNDPPIAANDSIATLEDKPVNNTVASNDTDSDNSASELTYTPISTLPASSGTLVLNPNGTYTFTPALNFTGTVVVTYKVCDIGGLCDTATLTLTFSPVNDAPVARDSTVSTNEDTRLTSDLKPHVSDPDNPTNTLVFSQIGSISITQGILTLYLDGAFIFTPAPNFNGPVVITYKVCDPSGLCDTATLTIIVSPKNDKPTVTPLSISTLEDTPTTVCTIINDADLGDTFIASPCGVNHGTATTTITGNQLCVTYSPSANYNGQDTACFIICDAGGLCDTLRIPITVSPVNDKPTVTPVSLSTLEDTSATVCTTINDADLGETFTARACGAQHGTARAAITGNQLCVTYTPNANYFGRDTACFIVCDANGGCDTVKIPVIISPINDKPVVTPLSISTLEDTSATVCTTINDADLGETFTVTLCGVKNGTATATITANQLCVTYSPSIDYNGRDTICLTVCDAGGLCDTLRIPITVSPVNDKPSVTPVNITTAENTPATVCTPINDVDLGETFTATLCSVKHGTATATIASNQLCVKYTPSNAYNGLDTVCVIVCDAGGACDTVKIPVVILAVNDRPLVTPIQISTLEDVIATVCTIINDVDLGETFTATLCGVNHGIATATIIDNKLCVTYSPLANYSGRDTVCYLVCDAGGACDTVKIPVTILPVNDKPIVTPTSILTVEDSTATVCTIINDVDLGETFNATLCGVNHGTATATITGNKLCVTYSPSANYNGLDTICFVVCDAAGACDTVKIPITISPINDKPVVSPPLSISTVEDSSATICTTINDVDLGETFTATLCGVNHGTATATITGNQLCVKYSPSPNYNGLDTACFIICDRVGACDTVKIPITVLSINDKPSVIPLSISTVEDSTATVCTIINDMDLGETFNATLCGVNHGTATATITGNKLCVTYSPSANYNGLDTACFIVCDAAGACDTVKISITIKAVNDTPSLKITPVFILKDSTSQICFDIQDNDRNDTHTVTLCGVQKGNAVVTLVNKQACVTYTTLKSYLGQDTLCILVCDSAGICKQVLIPVTVSDCNDQLAPILTCPAKIEVSIMGTIIADPNNFIIQNSFSDNCDGLKLDFNKIPAIDDCGIPTVSQISGLTKDSVFHVGRHFLTFQAKDLTSKTATCQVEIEVSPIQLLETRKMTICPNENLSLKAKTYSGANYKWTGPRNVSIDSILLTVPRTAGEAVEVFIVSAKFGACAFTDSITVTFRVQPIVNNDVFKISMNTELSNTVLSNDSTITPQKHTIKVTKPVTDGKLTFNPDGSFVYKPHENYTGLDNFIYQVCPIDCLNTCETATATIKVFNEAFLNKGVNVITPNSDGMNDVLEIEGFDPDAPNNKSEIVIYNQWGNVVYSTSSYKNNWRGTFKDNPLPEGTYYFIFRKSPDAVPLKDFVTIIR